MGDRTAHHAFDAEVRQHRHLVQRDHQEIPDRVVVGLKQLILGSPGRAIGYLPDGWADMAFVNADQSGLLFLPDIAAKGVIAHHGQFRATGEFGHSISDQIVMQTGDRRDFQPEPLPHLIGI